MESAVSSGAAGAGKAITTAQANIAVKKSVLRLVNAGLLKDVAESMIARGRRQSTNLIKARVGFALGATV
ncbi:MAG: hypothetical protein WBX19_13885 [Terracidiphilus sp.]